MIGLPESFLKQYNEKHSPHTLFGVISSSISQGSTWATALLDWAKRKEITINGASKTATYTDAFGTDGYTDVGTNIGVSGGTMTCSGATSNADNRAWKLLGSTLSDTAWVIDFDFKYTAVSGTFVHYPLVVTDLQDVIRNPVNDQMGFVFELSGSNNVIKIMDSNNTSLAHSAIEYSITADTQYYIRLIRNNSLKLTMIVYTDSDRTEVINTQTLTLQDAYTGLDTIQHGTASASASGTATWTIDNLNIYNGVTTVENIPSQQTVTFEDDFSTDKSWTQTGTKIIFDATNDDISWNGVRDGLPHALSYDLTSTSETAWVLDYDFTVDNINNGSAGKYLFVGLSSDGTTDVLDSQDAIGLTLYLDGASAKTYRAVGSAATNIYAGTDFTTAGTTGTIYPRIRRLDADNMKVEIYADSARTILLDSQTDTITSAVNALRYIKVTSVDGAVGSGTFDGTVKNVKFYNNITEVNPATLTDYPLTIKIQGDADLQEKTTETFDEDFATDNWTDADSTNIGVAGGVLHAIAARDNTNDTSYIDLGTPLSDTAWVMRWKTDITTATQGASGSSNLLMLGISDSSGARSVSQDSIQLGYEIWSAGNTIGLNSNEAAVMGEASAGTAVATIAVQIYYWEMKRVSSTLVIVNQYADSAYSVLVNSISRAVTAATGGLRYLKCSNWDSTSTEDSDLIIDFDDIKIWDGITNPVTQETATFTDDFTSYGSQESADAVWVPKTTATDVNITNDNLDFNVVGTDTTALGFYYDLGLISETNWLLRFKLNFSTYTDGDFGQIPFAISDSGTAAIGTNQANVGMIVNRSTGVFLNVTDNSTHMVGNTGSAGSDFSASTDYYCQISRNHLNFNLKIFSDSAYSVLVQEINRDITSSIPVGLRYFKIANDTDSGTGETTGTLDDFEFWDGISTPNAEGRKIVFTDNAFAGDAVEYASETVSYDPINGDLEAVVKIPSLATGADTTIQMYYDYTPSATPSYVPEVMSTPTPTADEDFTNHTVDTTVDNTEVRGWTPNDASEAWIDEGTNALEFNQTNEASNNALAFDLHDTRGFGTATNISDSKWRLDFDTTLDSFSGTQNQSRHWFGLTSESETTGLQTAQDAIWLHFSPYGSDWGVDTSDNAVAPQATGTSLTFSTGTVYSWSLIRDGNTVIGHRWTDSTRTSIAQTSTQDISAKTITNLRYIKFSNRNQTSVGAVRGRIQNVVLYNEIFLVNNREQSTWNSNYKAVHHLQGNSTDSTVYGNDGTDTAVAWEQQNNSVGAGFDGVSGDIDLGSDASIDDIWASGGSVTFTINPKSDGESSVARILDKRHAASNGWYFETEQEASGLLSVEFAINWSGALAKWNTAISIPINELTTITLNYDSDSTSNNPVFIINGVRQTVGNGITETTAPSGTYTAGTAANLLIGNTESDTTTFDGLIDNVKISDVSRPSSEAITSYNAEKSDSDIITAGDENTQ